MTRQVLILRDESPHFGHGIIVTYRGKNNEPIQGEGTDEGGIVLPDGIEPPEKLQCMDCGTFLILGEDYDARKQEFKEPWQA